MNITADDLDALIEIVDGMITHGRMRAGLGVVDHHRRLTPSL